MSGIFIGVGEVLGGVCFGLMGKRMIRFGRDPIVIIGFGLHIVAFVLIYLNLANAAPLGDTKDVAFFNPPLASVALFCAFLLGLADACFNTQIYSMLGGVFSSQSAAAFACFKFVQSLGASATFGYSSVLGLHMQMAILLVVGTIGTLCFVIVERSTKRRAALMAEEKYDH